MNISCASYILMDANDSNRRTIEFNLTCSTRSINFCSDIYIIQINLCVAYSITCIVLHRNNKYCLIYWLT